MKKIIIIGNGFDLAHKINTSYIAFINNYLSNVREELNNKKYYEDEFLEIKCSHYSEFTYNKTFKEMTPFNWYIVHLENKFQKIIIYDGVRYTDNYFHVEMKSDLFNKIIVNAANKNWVDIENDYTESLFTCRNRLSEVKKLNEDFKYLRRILLGYLNTLEIPKKVTIEKYLDLFCCGKYNKYYFIVFNYTDTVSPYINKCLEMNHSIESINYIHGKLNDAMYPPIFGMGDEHSKTYKELKEYEYLDELFKYNKSSLYLNNDSYTNLLSDIDEVIEEKSQNNFFSGSNSHQNYTADFDIEIYGHSCSLSDRTLLKFLFQNNNCNNIKIYHHANKENYRKDVINISRHFDDPVLYRKKVKHYVAEDFMPQLKK